MTSANIRGQKAAPRGSGTSPQRSGTSPQRGNRLLAALPPADRQRLIARCNKVDLTFGQVLYEQAERIRHVYFPLDGFISLISTLDGTLRLEVGLVGAEGMLGASLTLGVPVAPLRAIVQGTGSALRMDANEFIRECAHNSALRKVLNRYLYVRIGLLAQMAACTRFHLVEARLARWVLMTRDQANSDTFRLTQEFMALMLGVRRAGITNAAGRLQKRKLISYSRGMMTILDGRGLEALSCACYATTLKMYSDYMR